MSLIEQLKFDDNGLIPAITQDAASGEVLMMAWMNAEAVAQTLASGKVHYYSRSRQKQWMKGESSGHLQLVKEIRFDCDNDCLLIKIEQQGAACHTGARPSGGHGKTLFIGKTHDSGDFFHCLGGNNNFGHVS